MAADPSIEWTRDLGEGRLLVMERDATGYRASLAGCFGAGSTQGDALGDLLARMWSYVDAAADFERSLSPGGPLDEKLKQLGQLVDRRVARMGTRCLHCLAGEPSVWDDVLFHYAHPHPEGDKLKFCHDPWRERCRRCSADVGACACAAAPSARQEPIT